jgi:hypothetical protein
MDAYIIFETSILSECGFMRIFEYPSPLGAKKLCQSMMFV